MTSPARPDADVVEPPRSDSHSAQRRLSPYLIAGYGAGQFGTQVCRDVPATLLLYFMTQALGVSPVIAGMAILLPKLWVVAGDLLVGTVSDRTAGRWGRRPFLIVGAFVAAAGFVGMFQAPMSAAPIPTAAYVGLMFVVLCTGLSLYAVPHLALASELSDEPEERTVILSVRQIFLLTAVLMSLVWAPYMIDAQGGGIDGYRYMAAVLGPLVLLTMLLPVLAIRRIARPLTIPSRGLVGDLRGAFSSRPFRALAGANFLQSVASGTANASSVFFIVHALGFDLGTFARFALLSIVGAAVSQPLWVHLARRIGRPSAYLTALLLHVVLLACCGFAPPKVMPVLVLLGVGVGIANAGYSLLSASLLTDVVRVHCGTAAGGPAMLCSIFTIGEKVGVALGTFLVAFLLQARGFVQSHGEAVLQSTEAVDATRYAYAGMTLGLQLATILVALRLRSVLGASPPALEGPLTVRNDPSL